LQKFFGSFFQKRTSLQTITETLAFSLSGGKQPEVVHCPDLVHLGPIRFTAGFNGATHRAAVLFFRA
jgi:hypothetical protein